MSKNSLGNSNKAFKTMVDATIDDVQSEVRRLLADVGGPRRAGETMQRWIDRAGRALGMPYARAYSIWYGRFCRLAAEEIDNIRRRAWASLEAAERRAEAETAALRAKRTALSLQIGDCR